MLFDTRTIGQVYFREEYTDSSTKKSQAQPKSFSDMVCKQRNKNNGVAKSGSLVDELTELHTHLDKAWDELADAVNLSSDSYFPELRALADKLFQYDELVGNLCVDVKELLDKLNQRD